MLSLEIVHNSISVWEAIWVIAASAVTVGGAVGLITRSLWKRVVRAQFDQMKRMMKANGLDTDQVGDVTGRVERDLHENYQKLRKQINTQTVKLRGEIRDIGKRLDEHLTEDDRDKADFDHRLSKKQDKAT